MATLHWDYFAKIASDILIATDDRNGYFTGLALTAWTSQSCCTTRRSRQLFGTVSASQVYWVTLSFRNTKVLYQSRTSVLVTGGNKLQVNSSFSHWKTVTETWPSVLHVTSAKTSQGSVSVGQLIKTTQHSGQTCSRYLDWILQRASHILHGFCVAGSRTSWLTTTLWVSMLHLVSSCTSLSVSNSDRNSAMQTHTNVVMSYTTSHTHVFSVHMSTVPSSLWHSTVEWKHNMAITVILTLKSMNPSNCWRCTTR